MTFYINPHARMELTQAADYFESKRPGYGAYFRQEFESALSRILSNPATWQEIRPGFRGCRMKVFKYIVIYKIETDVIGVYAVAHPSRKPGYWNNRV